MRSVEIGNREIGEGAGPTAVGITTILAFVSVIK